MAVQNVDDLFQQARAAMERGNAEKSRQLYLQALSLKPDSPDVHYGLASVCFQMDDLASAAYHFKEVTRLDPLRAGAYINLGAVYNLLDQLDDAIPVLRRGIQLDSQRAEGYYNLGLVYRRKGQASLAISAYQEALRANPRLADAHYNLANIYLEQGEYAQAKPHYKLALKLRPSWDKAAAGLQQAKEALAEEQARTGTGESESNPRQPSALLNHLHKATVESEDSGRHFLQVMETEMEPALKELSACLTTSDNKSSELEACLHKFESAVQNMRSAHRSLQTTIENLRTIGDQLNKD